MTIAVPLGLLACRGGPSGGSVPPAHVENPTTEAALTTVRLTPQAVERIGIEVAPVARRDVTHRRTLGGEIMAPPGTAVTVAAPRAATVLRADSGAIPAAGSRVTEGQPLVRLVILLDGGALARIQEDVSVAHARYNNAAIKAERSERLVRQGVASAAEYEDARAELESAEAVLVAARARLTVLQQGQRDTTGGLSTITLRAPAPGIVRNVHVAEGQTVSDGAPLLEIVQLSPLWVRVPVYVGDVSSIDRLAPATIISPSDDPDASGDHAVPVQGPPTANPASSSADLFYRIENRTSRYRPGERVGVSVALQGSAEKLTIPWSAVLLDINGGTWVYEVRGEDVYVRSRVEVEDVIGELAVLRRGPAVGTSVVTVGAAELFSTEFGTSH